MVLVPSCGERCQRYTLALLVLILVIYSLFELYRVGSDLVNWDLLIISGVFAFLVGLWLARTIPDKFQSTLDRLADRGVLIGTKGKTPKDDLENLKSTLDRRAEIWARAVAVVLAVAMMAAYLVAYREGFTVVRIFVATAEVIGAYIAGTLLGRMACFGQFGWILGKQAIEIKVVPGHVDGAAGLKPVGDFYFFQAMVAAIPAVYLAAWWVLIPFTPQHDYDVWREPYLGLLMIAIGLEVLAFFVPLWSFHKQMKNKKQELFKEADELSARMNDIQRKIIDLESYEEKKALRDHVSEIADQYWTIEKMPTWPVDVRTRRRFGLNNFLLLLPLVGNFIGTTEAWQAFVNIITTFIGG